MEAEVKQVAISINGRDYDIACDDGQEEHLTRLAGFVDERVQELVSTVGNIGDMRLLVLTSLLIADELHENRRAREQEREERSQAGEQARSSSWAWPMPWTAYPTGSSGCPRGWKTLNSLQVNPGAPTF